MDNPLSEDRKVVILRGTSLFSGLTDAEVSQLAAAAHALRLKPKEPLFFRGDPGDRLYIVVEGVVRIGSISAEGLEVTLNLMKPGQVFGEIAAFDGSERTANASAVDHVLLLALDRTHLMEFLATGPEAGMRLMAALCERLRWVNGLLEDANFLDIPARLAKRVMLLAYLFGTTDDQGQTQVSLTLSQQDLASHIGATRESVNKFIKKWEDDGVILHHHRHLTILDKDYLIALYEPRLQ